MSDEVNEEDVLIEAPSFEETFTLAVKGISLGLIIDQLDLPEWMPEWLEDKHDCDPDITDCLDWREIALRGICICAMDAKKILVSEYGLDESDFIDDDVA